MRVRISLWIMAGLLAITAATWAAHAADRLKRPTPGIRDEDGELWDTPVYDENSKKYYALIWSHRANDVYTGYVWEQAYADAKSREFKGVHGRLATVDSLEVHEFLERTFHPTDIYWIGLYYACTSHKLLWANGEPWKPGFQAWDTNWKQDPYACKSGGDKAKDIMPIAYTPIDKGFRWIGKGRFKGYYGYFIEFPTGQP